MKKSENLKRAEELMETAKRLKREMEGDGKTVHKLVNKFFAMAGLMIVMEIKEKRGTTDDEEGTGKLKSMNRIVETMKRMKKEANIKPGR